ncbi:MAG TPA: hypothetical protein VGX95_03725 [Xanthobacteraceae bacterium]|jgi:hypothetical protein|nr:hypothetical protein [Xanthobacteraceae bacterium]
MGARGLAASVALCGTLVLAGWGAAERFGAPFADTGARVVPAASAADAGPIDVPQAATGEKAVAVADPATIDAAMPAPAAPPEPPVQLASVGTSDPVRDDAKDAAGPIAPPDECVAADICIDRYLWSVYERTPKEDTITVTERVKATVKLKNGKTRTVTKTVAKLVDEDFAWKDPKAAQKAGMSLMDYVIGGMDPSFRLKLYHALRAMDAAGLEPGITSAFRDDYRQELASGKKAATDRSYHGGSLRGGYGHGLAADLVSVKGATRAQRWSSSQELWKWIDAHEQELGVGRPYLDRDPPHVGPIDGKEYADKRGRANARLARSEANKGHRSAVNEDHGKTKGAKTASSDRGANSLSKR